MTVYVYQTFEIKQDKFQKAFETLGQILDYRNEKYDQHAQLLSPISGNDFRYVLFTSYDGLAEMEFQNRKMFEDDQYKQMFEEFFTQDIVQGTLETQMYRSIHGLHKVEKKD